MGVTRAGQGGAVIRARTRAALVAAISLLVACRSRDDGTAATSTGGEPDPIEPSCASFDPLRRPFFGDLHVHTALSLDANLSGTRLRPADAYRFARGETVELPPYDADGRSDRTLTLSRPLDFVALSDHAEFLGLVTTCLSPGYPGYDSVECAAYRDDPQMAFVQGNANLARTQGTAVYPEPCTEANAFCGDATLAAWAEVRDAAAQAQDSTDACTFTSFVAYEWSGSPGTKNLHRNVIFADDRVPARPVGYFDADEEEELWAALDRDCIDGTPGCDVLTIPHNSNLSAGLMFEAVDAKGDPIDVGYAEQRARFEPLVEVFQHKGSSECLPELGNDEECAFEVVPYDTLSSAALGLPREPHAVDFVRDALGQGLRLQAELGANPFAYGFVGSTDTHSATPGAVEERTFAGHGGASYLAPDASIEGLVDHVWFNPGGLAVLWAEENSRAALFAAMKRREAYATSGPRIVLRTFAGFDLPEGLCDAPDFVAQGYARGVPMGGELTGAPSGAALRVAIWAMRDPGTAAHPSVGLERLQIIKGWLEDGEPRYRVLDVAGTASDEPFVDETCAPIDAGADEICAVFEDDELDPATPAFYYARVLEGPSCRWSAHACRAAAVDCSDPDGVPEALRGCCDGPPELGRERAWSSPVFYRPGR